MYVLEIRKKDSRKYSFNNDNFKSFEDFEFLMREKERIEKLGDDNICLVYKISSNGKEVTKLSKKSEYEVVTDFDKEFRKGWKQYVSIREQLVKCGFRNFYVSNGILYIEGNNGVVEVELVRKTPRYEVRKNGKILRDDFTSQGDIIDYLFVKNKSRLCRKFC